MADLNKPNEPIQIVDLRPESKELVSQTAALLVEGFAEHSPTAWPDMDSALEEVEGSFEEGRISRVALDSEGRVVGWIGGIPDYRDRALELHPLVVKPALQGRGIGRLLVDDLERIARERGVVTIILGTDDEDNQTNLSGVDLYTDIPGYIRDIKSLRGHAFAFYQKLGFTVVGVLPDVNGPGKPDILMARRVGGGSKS